LFSGELPDPNADAIMSRCNVCSEKAYVNTCAHCDKKVCDDCKEAHGDILKREISRINNQIKRGWHRLEDCLKQVERNQQQLDMNAATVLKEIEEIHRRLVNALTERTDYLKNSVEKYLMTESVQLKELKTHLDLELTNIQSNSDLMEKHLTDDTKWDDNELMDCKEIFIKMMDFIRNYDPGNEEYTRRIRFTTHDCVNDLSKKILEIGDLKIHDNSKPKDEEDFPMRSTALSRSKSDHRLVAEFRRRDETERSPPTRRRFGDSRYSKEDNKSRTNFGVAAASRFDEDDDEDRSARGSRFRSRFLRNEDDDDAGGYSGGGGGGSNRKSMIDSEEDKMTKKERTKVVETEDASRGPLSGCIRLADSSRIIQRLKVSE
jgi:tripartite motif-containing protein 71